MPYKIAMYTRLSKEDKEKIKVESESIVNQKFIIENFIKNNFELRGSEVISYSDDGYVGSNFQRPAIKQLIEDVKKGKINCIIVKDLSRFGRNYIEVVNYLENILPFFKVRFIAINDNFDSKNSRYNLNDIDINFKNIIYDYYSKDLSNKIMSSKISKAKQGNYLGCIAPFGYKKSKEQKGKLEIDNETSLIVKQIFKLFLDGKSCLEISKILNKNNVKTRMEFINKKIKTNVSLWKREHIREILSNKVYIGTLEYLKTSKCIKTRHKQITNDKKDWIIVDNAHKGIICKEDFYKVQQLLKNKKINKSKERKNIFAYRLYCGNCGYSLYNSTKKYFCRTMKYEYSNNCKDNIIEKKTLENVVLKSIEKIVFNINSDNIKNKIKLYEKELTKLENEKDEIYMLYLDENIDKEQYLINRKNIENRKEDIFKKIENLKIKKYIKLDSMEKDIYENELTYEIIDLFIKKIYVYDKNIIEIRWNFKLEF